MRRSLVCGARLWGTVTLFCTSEVPPRRRMGRPVTPVRCGRPYHKGSRQSPAADIHSIAVMSVRFELAPL